MHMRGSIYGALWVVVMVVLAAVEGVSGRITLASMRRLTLGTEECRERIVREDVAARGGVGQHVLDDGEEIEEVSLFLFVFCGLPSVRLRPR
jgi:hypothetical protein